jgi:hypothetical protein
MKPVAWIAYDEFGDFMLEPTPDGDYPWQPLYTAPIELSDDEITFLWHQSMNLAISDENLKNNISHATIFARAILKKARE